MIGVTGCKKQSDATAGGSGGLFEAEHPDIKLDIVRDSTGVISAKLMAEASNPRADVVWGVAATNLLNADHAGLLAAYSPKGFDQLSAEYKDNRPEPHWEGIDAFMTAFAVNTVELAKVNAPLPRSYADLIKRRCPGPVFSP
jgi:iron(III) transport system substrate-binding protein